MVSTPAHRRRYRQPRHAPRAGRVTQRAKEAGQNHRQMASIAMTAAPRAARVTQPRSSQMTAATVRMPAARGCRAASRTRRPSSRASWPRMTNPAGVR